MSKEKSSFPLISGELVLRPSKEDDIWNEEWIVSLKSDPDNPIGHMHFEKTDIAGEVGIVVELEPEYRNKGYGTQIFRIAKMFVFNYRNIRELRAVCKHENHSCVQALCKAGYVFRENVNGTDYYSYKKDKSAWTGLYVCIGFMAGLILGLVISNLVIGLVIGLLAGFVIGRGLDAKENGGLKKATRDNAGRSDNDDPGDPNP